MWGLVCEHNGGVGLANMKVGSGWVCEHEVGVGFVDMKVGLGLRM